MTGLAAQQATYGLVRYRDAQNIVTATCSVAFSEPHRSTSAKFSYRNDQ
jgi:hypothetical protein